MITHIYIALETEKTKKYEHLASEMKAAKDKAERENNDIVSQLKSMTAMINKLKNEKQSVEIEKVALSQKLQLAESEIKDLRVKIANPVVIAENNKHQIQRKSINQSENFQKVQHEYRHEEYENENEDQPQPEQYEDCRVYEDQNQIYETIDFEETEQSNQQIDSNFEQIPVQEEPEFTQPTKLVKKEKPKTASHLFANTPRQIEPSQFDGQNWTQDLNNNFDFAQNNFNEFGFQEYPIESVPQQKHHHVSKSMFNEEEAQKYGKVKNYSLIFYRSSTYVKAKCRRFL